MYKELPASDTLTSLETYFYPGTGFNPVPIDSSDEINIDVNEDGELDLKLRMHHDYSFTPESYGLVFKGLHDRVKIALGTQKDAYEWDALVLTEGTKIHKKLNWDTGGADLWASEGYTSGGTSNATNISDGTHYVAFQLDYNLRKTYGWLKFTKVGFYVYDISYAYNPRGTISAGEK